MRIYLPGTSTRLQELLATGAVGPPPLTAFAVTPGLREWYVDDDAEELEYAATLEAARGSLRLLDADAAAARRRVARALGVLRRTLPDAPSVEGLENLGRWLEDFHPHSRVELDYGGIVEVLSDEQVRAETSVADVAESLAALQRGDGAAAGEAYERLLSRWRVLQLREQSN